MKLLKQLEVFSPPGNPIGSVHQKWSLCEPKFSVKDATGETILYIKGPFCTCCACCDVKFKVIRYRQCNLRFSKIDHPFQVYSADGQKIGKISKQWSGLVREAFTDADTFGINFPIDLDPKIKAVLIGACLLIVIIL